MWDTIPGGGVQVREWTSLAYPPVKFVPLNGQMHAQDEGGEVRVREWTSPADPPELDEAGRDSLMGYLASVLPGWQGLGDAVKQVGSLPFLDKARVCDTLH